MRQETHVLGDIFARRFCADQPRYVLLISHGIGGHSGIYNAFCEHHAAKGAEIWAYDAPGHGMSTMTRGRGNFRLEEWVAACVAYGEHIKAMTGLPVFALGSSLGVAASYSALYSDAFDGAVLMGSTFVPGAATGLLANNPFSTPALDPLVAQYGKLLRLDIGRLVNFDVDYGYNGAVEQKKLDSYNTWMYDLDSFRSLFCFDPKIPVGENKKPILFAVGDGDALTSTDSVHACAAAMSGPVEVRVLSGAPHQLMLFDTRRFSDLVDTWVGQTIAA